MECSIEEKIIAYEKRWKMSDLMNEANQVLEDFTKFQEQRKTKNEELGSLVDQAVAIQQDQRVYIKFLERIIGRYNNLAKEYMADEEAMNFTTKLQELIPKSE